MPKNTFTHFEHRTCAIESLKMRFLSWIFTKMTAKSLGIFLKGKDYISIHPQIAGVHEPELTAFIDAFSKEGYSNFLIDIGANIGLTSCQNGSQFKEIHMYEPNPLCCNILRSNAQISLDSSKYTIHPFGLGDSEKTTTLTVPKSNWGGAFVNDESNAYDDDLLTKKDGFDSVDKQNYFEVEIAIKKTKDELSNLFQKLSDKGLTQGVIKIDVEGYEQVVLMGIAEAFPAHMKAYIVFESWDSNFCIEEIVKKFKRPVLVGKLCLHTPWEKHWPKILKLLSLIFKRHSAAKLEEVTDGDYKGDIVLKV